MILERNAVQALHNAVEKKSAAIGQQVEQAMVTPLIREKIWANKAARMWLRLRQS